VFLRQHFKAISENLNSKLVVVEEAKQYDRSPTGKCGWKEKRLLMWLLHF